MAGISLTTARSFQSSGAKNSSGGFVLPHTLRPHSGFRVPCGQSFMGYMLSSNVTSVLGSKGEPGQGNQTIQGALLLRGPHYNWQK